MESRSISNRVIGCAIEVHRTLGPGLLESTYEECLVYELSRGGIQFNRQLPQPICYKDVKLDCGFRIDLLVENTLLLELKSVQCLTSIHESQLITYMKLAEVKTGLLINFNVALLKDGLKRFVI